MTPRTTPLRRDVVLSPFGGDAGAILDALLRASTARIFLTREADEWSGMSSIDVTVDLVRAITGSLDVNGHDDWESYSAVLDPQDNDFSVVSRTAGYLFSADGFIGSAGVMPRPIQSAVRAYMESHYAEGERWPARILVQFNRKSGQYKVLFEESDKHRWKLTPSNMEAMYEELRPQF